MSLGEYLDRKMAAFVKAQQGRAPQIAAFCLIGFVVNTGLTGFAAVVAPTMVGIFAYSGVLLLVGAVSNAFLALRR